MKINWTWIIIAALVILAVILLLDNCTHGKFLGCNRPASDTVSSKIDTTKKQVKDSIVYVPTPYKVDSLIYVPRPFAVHDTLPGEVQYVPTDTAAILRDYNAVKYYSKDIPVTYGSLNISDTVSRNNIIGRGVYLSQTIPEVTKTITVKPAPRNTLYIAGNITGGFVWSAGIGVGMKDKKDRIFKVSYNSTVSGQQLVQGEVLLPVRLGKNK